MKNQTNIFCECKILSIDRILGGITILLCLTLFALFPGSQVYSQASPRERLETFVLSQAKLAALKRGVQVMKARKPSDPTSWFYQGAIHAVSDEAIAEARLIDPAVDSVDKARFWNRCPHFGAHSADFPIWHRAYIYHFERILRQASGDPTLSLPYWNYTDSTQRTFPRMFANQFDDPAQTVVNPLYDARRELSFMLGLYQLSDRAVSPDDAFNETVFFGSDERSGFAGGVWDSDPNTQGRIESRPHNMMHLAIGGVIDQTAGSMSDVPTAAFDPVFWIHHSNIDRLWTVWECTSTTKRTWGYVPDKVWLDERPWDFNDINGVVETKSRRFYLDRRNIDVRYDTDRGDCLPLSATDPSTGSIVDLEFLAIDKSIKSFVKKSVAGTSAVSGRFTPDKVSSVSISVAPLASPGGLKSTILESKKVRPRRVYLEISDLALEGIVSSGFDVFVNLPDGVEASRTSMSYVGTLPIFGHSKSSSHSGHTASGKATVFDITRLVLNQPDVSRLDVKIVPFDLLVPIGSNPRIQRQFGFTYRAISVVVVEGSKSLIK